MRYKLLVFIIVILFGNTVFAQPIKINNDAKIYHNIYEGIKIIDDCKLTFRNNDDIIIGDMYNNVCSGIEVVPGKKLTICLEGFGDVNVYGGCYQSLGNTYSCAGIYVPENSTIIIESKGNSVLNAVGCKGAAGIGGQGVDIYNSDTDYSITNAGKIYIKSGSIRATSCCNNFSNLCGTGAGIGGGGIYNLIDRQEISGGSVELIEIYDGNIVAIGGNCENCNGTGAGIGGGGICNVAQNVDYIRGGDLKKINIFGGEITARGGNNNNTRGRGAGIGGGGIYNSGKCEKIKEGQLISINDEHLTKFRSFKGNMKVGSGGIYSNDTNLKGLLPTKVKHNRFMKLKESISNSIKKIVSAIVMGIVGVLVMVGK